MISVMSDSSCGRWTAARVHRSMGLAPCGHVSGRSPGIPDSERGLAIAPRGASRLLHSPDSACALRSADGKGERGDDRDRDDGTPSSSPGPIRSGSSWLSSEGWESVSSWLLGNRQARGERGTMCGPRRERVRCGLFRQFDIAGRRLLVCQSAQPIGAQSSDGTAYVGGAPVIGKVAVE
jgi:hypothetical protein